MSGRPVLRLRRQPGVRSRGEESLPRPVTRRRRLNPLSGQGKSPLSSGCLSRPRQTCSRTAARQFQISPLPGKQTALGRLARLHQLSIHLPGLSSLPGVQKTVPGMSSRRKDGRAQASQQGGVHGVRLVEFLLCQTVRRLPVTMVFLHQLIRHLADPGFPLHHRLVPGCSGYLFPVAARRPFFRAEEDVHQDRRPLLFAPGKDVCQLLHRRLFQRRRDRRHSHAGQDGLVVGGSAAGRVRIGLLPFHQGHVSQAQAGRSRAAHHQRGDCVRHTVRNIQRPLGQGIPLQHFQAGIPVHVVHMLGPLSRSVGICRRLVGAVRAARPARRHVQQCASHSENLAWHREESSPNRVPLCVLLRVLHHPAVGPCVQLPPERLLILFFPALGQIIVIVGLFLLRHGVPVIQHSPALPAVEGDFEQLLKRFLALLYTRSELRILQGAVFQFQPFLFQLLLIHQVVPVRPPLLPDVPLLGQFRQLILPIYRAFQRANPKGIALLPKGILFLESQGRKLPKISLAARMELRKRVVGQKGVPSGTAHRLLCLFQLGFDPRPVLLCVIQRVRTPKRRKSGKLRRFLLPLAAGGKLVLFRQLQGIVPHVLRRLRQIDLCFFLFPFLQRVPHPGTGVFQSFLV